MSGDNPLQSRADITVALTRVDGRYHPRLSPPVPAHAQQHLVADPVSSSTATNLRRIVRRLASSQSNNFRSYT